MDPGLKPAGPRYARTGMTKMGSMFSIFRKPPTVHRSPFFAFKKVVRHCLTSNFFLDLAVNQDGYPLQAEGRQLIADNSPFPIPQP
jgi:hypothetical protein